MSGSGHGGNGQLEIAAPIGSLRIAGRDLMLAVTLIILGAAAVYIQFVTLRSFTDPVLRELAALASMEERGSRERGEILALSKARICTDTFLDAARASDPRVLERVERSWATVCFGTSRIPVMEGEPPRRDPPAER